MNLNRPRKIAMNFGIGLSYPLSGRFTLRSGFYAGEKLYSANKNEYHAPLALPGLEYLYNITANCKVYEIPVTLSFNFRKLKNHGWFASAGLSTYLMKKESYEYYYKYPSGSIYTKSWSIFNQNQHFFSVLDLSPGYSYSFNKKISLLTEPYLKFL